MPRLVTIDSYSTPEEAEMARAALDANGIESFLEGEASVGNFWYLGNAMGGVKLQVAEPDAKSALAVLEADEDDAPTTPAEAQPIHCATCGAETEPGFDTCWKCGTSLVSAFANDPVTAVATTLDEEDSQRPRGESETAEFGRAFDDWATTEAGDDMVSRAWRVALIAVLCWMAGALSIPYFPIFIILMSPPLAISSVWVLVKVTHIGLPLSRQGKHKYVLALAVDGAVICLTVWLVTLIGRPW